MTADEFDRWMRARQLHVATGTAKTMSASPRVPAAPVATAPAPATTIPAMPTPVAARSSEPVDATALTFQVASFAARANAEHALAMLAGAGIDGARLLDADANGRRVWRLRVGRSPHLRRRNSSRASRVWASANRSACASKLARFPLFPFRSRTAGYRSPLLMNEVSKPMRARRAPLIAARAVLAALSTAVVGSALAQAPALPQPAKPAALSDALPIPPAPAPKTSAAWILMDFATGQVLAGENYDKRHEPASITKVMTSYVIAAEMAASAAARSSAMTTPLPAASPSAFNTTGHPKSREPTTRIASSSDRAV